MCRIQTHNNKVYLGLCQTILMFKVYNKNTWFSDAFRWLEKDRSDMWYEMG